MQQGHTLFVLQNELIDKKMEAAMSTRLVTFRNEIRDEFRADLDKAVTLIREDLSHFKSEMREFKQELRDIRYELHGFGMRLTTVESVLGVIQQRQGEIRTRLLDYSFKAVWIILFGFSSFLGNYVYTLIR